MYVNDTLIFSPKKEWIEENISRLKQENVDLEEEDSEAGFLTSRETIKTAQSL